MFKFVVRASCPLCISREQDAPTTAYFEYSLLSVVSYQLSVNLVFFRIENRIFPISSASSYMLRTYAIVTISDWCVRLQA